MYYIFNNDLAPLISGAIESKKGDGFFDFKEKQKLVEVTNIPNSNTDNTPINNYRTVFVLETVFDEADKDLEKSAKELSEFYSENSDQVLEYLNIPDKWL